MDIQSKILQSTAHVREILDEKRFAHCERTALYAQSVAIRFGVDPQKAFLAGIVHDICKRMDVEEMIRWVKLDDLPQEPEELQTPGLLHGRAAAVYIQKILEIDDLQIIDAVRYHTSGKPYADNLTLLVYAADKIEPGRKFETQLFRTIGEEKGLYSMVLAVARHIVVYLKNDSKQPTPATLAMIQWLENYETPEHI